MRFASLIIAASVTLITSASSAFAAASIMGTASPLGGEGGRIVSIVDDGSYTYVGSLTSANAIDGSAGITSNYVAIDANRGINPKTIAYTLTFAAAYDLGSFVLWNDRDVTDTGGTRNNGDGVQFFNLEFFNVAGLSLGVEKFLAQDLVNQLVFDFASDYTDVLSVKWSILNFYTDGPGHDCGAPITCQHQFREIGFNFFEKSGEGGSDGTASSSGGGAVPEPATIGLMTAALGLLAWRRRART